MASSPWSFNLRIEILIIGSDIHVDEGVILKQVSISELRFLSLVGVAKMGSLHERFQVSISELRFLSLVAFPHSATHSVDACFNLRIEILIIGSECYSKYIDDRFIMFQSQN